MADALFNDEFLKRIELLFLISKKVFAGSTQAMRRSRRLGAGIDVADFRTYVSGDDLRHVDWNYYATTRELLIRLFEEEEDLRIYFLLDASRSMRVGDGTKLDHARRVVGALSYIGLANLDRVSVVPFGDDVAGVLPASRGRSQIWKVFRFLSGSPEPVRTDLLASVRRFVAQTRRRGLVVLVSDFYDPRGFEAAIDMLRHHRFEPLVIQVWDEDDVRPSLRGDIDVIDCETGEAVPVTVTAGLVARLAEAQEALVEEVAGYCRRKNVLHFRAPVQVPFDELVLQVFRAGGFVR
jgi:uncharacterized protein (DUF58 family)